jgi:hypothetical protein
MDTTNLIFENIKSVNSKAFETLLLYVKISDKKANNDDLYIEIRKDMDKIDTDKITKEEILHEYDNVYNIKDILINNKWWYIQLREYICSIDNKKYLTITFNTYDNENINTAHYELREMHLYYTNNTDVILFKNVLKALAYYYKNESEIKSFLVKLNELRNKEQSNAI